jgi:hypothetical protein
MKNRFCVGLSALLLATLACRPIITIGWEELLFLVFLIILLIGPPIYRFLRRLEKYRRKKEK